MTALVAIDWGTTNCRAFRMGPGGEILEKRATAMGILAVKNANFAGALFQTGRAEEAVAQYRMALQLQPAYVEAHLNLALVLARLGRNGEAIAAYEAALRLKPDEPRATEGLARLRGR